MPYKCPIKQKEAQHKSYLKNKDRIRKRTITWRQNNYEAYRCAQKINNRDYRKSNPDKLRHLCAKRRAAELLRTPKWLTKEDLKQIALIYKEANRLSIETKTIHHVDHIIPLQGIMVSGLHVPSNLQILRADENIRKGNKFVPGELKL